MKSELFSRTISSLFLIFMTFLFALINDYLFLSILFVTIILSRIKVGIDIQEINDKALNAVSKFINLGNSNQISKNEATLVWSCKECIYKWYQKGSVNFLNDIKIHSFKIKEKGKITANFKNQEFTLFYRKVQNHFLVYVCK